jgi:hypothetical protein
LAIPWNPVGIASIFDRADQAISCDPQTFDW